MFFNFLKEVSLTSTKAQLDDTILTWLQLLFELKTYGNCKNKSRHYPIQLITYLINTSPRFLNTLMDISRYFEGFL